MSSLDYKTQTATERGWRRRPDMGLDVWETENGTLYRHDDNGEPQFQIIDTSKMFPHLKGRS